MTLQFEGVGFNAGPGGGGKTGTVVLVAMGSQPSTPYTVGSKWFYNGKIYTATTTTAHDSGVTPSYDTAYLFNGTYYYWDGSTLQGADESNLVHISGTETITGNKTFSGKADFQGETTAVTQATSDTSQKVATTQFVKNYAEDGEWQKPADWIDIRSGALSNSIILLVAHAKPVLSDGVYSIATYPKFRFIIGLTDSSHSYDVFVDGKKIATSASGATTIDWEELYNTGVITSGFDVSYPSELTTHIVRFTPTISNDEIILARAGVISGQQGQGILWAHFELSNAIKIAYLLGQEAAARNVQCRAITAKNDKIKFIVESSGNTGLFSFALSAENLVKIPVLEADTDANTIPTYLAFFNTFAIKEIKIKNNSANLGLGAFHNCRAKKIEIENPVKLQSGSSGNTTVDTIYYLKKFPKISTSEKGTIISVIRADSLEPTFIDDSFNDARTLFRFRGASGHQTNLVGLTVSSSAPFSFSTSPQIDISYTNMSRIALVNLFNSLPTVSDSQVINITGAIGAGDLTAEDLAIATGKGWTVTR